jgi:hypothetical protein
MTNKQLKILVRAILVAGQLTPGCDNIEEYTEQIMSGKFEDEEE